MWALGQVYPPRELAGGRLGRDEGGQLDNYVLRARRQQSGLHRAEILRNANLTSLPQIVTLNIDHLNQKVHRYSVFFTQVSKNLPCFMVGENR